MARAPFSPACLHERLAALAPEGATKCALVAFSGGLDSTVLLHALAALDEWRVRALHVHHALHADADEWSRHAMRVCERLGVDGEVRMVEVGGAGGIEAAARAVRYATLAEALGRGEVLLTAHHEDDQLETLLLQLLRGAGPAGLAAMPAAAPFAAGWHLRPLLDQRRDALAAYAHANGLEYLTDPANADLRFDRSYLRQAVLPALEARWPAAASSAARSAALAAEADELLGDLARLDAGGELVGDSLDLAPLAALRPARWANVVRAWLRANGLRTPNQARLSEFVRQLQAAAPDRQPALRYDDVTVRAFHGRLWHCDDTPSAAAGFEAELQPGGDLVLPAGLGSLRLEPVRGRGIAARHVRAGLRVRFRRGGESLRPHADAHSTTLKKLMSTHAILPWRRDGVPIVWCDERIACVGDLWDNADFAPAPDEDGFAVQWRDRPEPLLADRSRADRRTGR